MAWAPLRALRFALVLVPPALGCSLIVPPIEPGAHCDIGGNSPCAACLRRNCQDSIDRCCLDATCSNDALLSGLDRCGEGDRDGCATGLAQTVTEIGKAARTCALSSCAAECSDRGTVAWSCTAPQAGLTDCAACVFDRCGSALQQCCAASCEKKVSEGISRCISGDTAGCAWFVDESDTGLDGVVRGCIAKSCAACLGDGRKPQSCSPMGGGTYCTCSGARESSGPTCSIASVGGGRCYQTDETCTCGEYSCKATSLGCTCGLTAGPGSTSCRAAKGTVCCLELSEYARCRCELSSCYTDSREFAVPSCDASDVEAAMAAARRSLTACSN